LVLMKGKTNFQNRLVMLIFQIRVRAKEDDITG
jgi:hypothetical protein